MEVGIVDRQKLVNIADAVRKKKGITKKMTLDAIASNITSMPISDNNAKFDFSVSKSEGDLIGYLTTIDLSNFDTSNYTSTNGMFSDYSSLTSLDLSNFNTSNVTNMIYMFSNCSSLTSLDLSNFDTSKVNDMTAMFADCSSLTSLDLSNFNTSKVTYLSSMFFGCSSLTSLDLSNWNTSNVAWIKGIFEECSKLSNLTLGTDWASHSNIDSFDLSFCPLTHESAVDVINKLATRSNSPVITFSNQVGLYQSEIDVATNKGWSVSGCRVLVEDPTTATVGQRISVDGVPSICVYVADTPQDWGQRIFASQSNFTDSNGKSTFQWGGYGTDTRINETTIGTGLSNTDELLAMNLQSTDGTPTIWDAITEFRSTHSERWFIPSRNELETIIDNYTYDSLWSSTELDSKASYGSNSRYIKEIEKTKTYSVLPCIYV